MPSTQKIWDRLEWQRWVSRLLFLKYGHDGCAYQCYVADEPVSTKALYEKQRDTLRRSRRCPPKTGSPPSASALRALPGGPFPRRRVCLANHSATVELDASLVDPDLATNHPHLTLLDARKLAGGLEVQRIPSANGLPASLPGRAWSWQGRYGPASRAASMQHRLNFLPEPHGHAALRSTRWSAAWGAAPARGAKRRTAS